MADIPCMGRPRKTLHERIVGNTFRRDRYGRLLDGRTLPVRPPWRDIDRWAAWRALGQVQIHYQNSRSSGERRGLLIDFARLVRILHGARWPPELFDYFNPDENRQAALERELEQVASEYARATAQVEDR
jgi:hypothetical protein